MLRLGCFRYFECGGDCVRSPISFLAGLAPDPALLVYHFFAVAVYSVQLLFEGRLHSGRKGPAEKPPLSAYPLLLWRSVVVLCYACIVILPVLITELQLNLAVSRSALLWQYALYTALFGVAMVGLGSYWVHS